MATIKSYTDIEQSRKLAEILPLESADAIYEYCGAKLETSKLIEKPIYWLVIKGFESCCRFSASKKDIPCWSLASLLCVLHYYTLQTNTDGTVFVVCDSKKPMISDAYDNPIDACVAMIEKLHELKML